MSIDAINDRVSQTTGTNYDVVFTDKKDNSILDPSSFLQLLVVQMQNQDMSEPMDNSELVTQMSQFTNIQIMEQMSLNSQSSYAISMVGKTVTASRFTVAGDLDTTTGVVDKVSLVDNEYILYIDDKKYTLDQIMEVGTGNSTITDATSDFSLKVSEVQNDRATIEWSVPAEHILDQDNLRYTVYYSDAINSVDDFDTLEEVESGKVWGASNQFNINSAEILGLQKDTPYYANVVVTFADGAKQLLEPVKFTTFL